MDYRYDDYGLFDGGKMLCYWHCLRCCGDGLSLQNTMCKECEGTGVNTRIRGLRTIIKIKKRLERMTRRITRSFRQRR